VLRLLGVLPVLHLLVLPEPLLELPIHLRLLLSY
jgi:hypothetical protein